MHLQPFARVPPLPSQSAVHMHFSGNGGCNHALNWAGNRAARVIRLCFGTALEGVPPLQQIGPSQPSASKGGAAKNRFAFPARQ